MKKLFVFLAVIFAVTLTFTSCEKPEDDPVLPLSVTSVTPSNNAVGVKVEDPIVLNFSRPVSKTPANLVGIVLTKSTGETVVTSMTFSDDGASVTIKPSGLLANNVIYKLAVKDVQTDDGAIVTPYSSSFTTITTPLTVVAVVPADGSKDLQNIKQIVFTLNKKIANTKSNLDGIRFGEYGLDGVLIIRSYPLLVKSISEDGLSVIISFPEYLLSAGVKYAAALDKISAEDGAFLSYSAMTFTMKDVPLAVANITPANGAKDVALDSKVVVIFNKQLKPSTIPGFTVNGYAGESWSMEFDGTKTVTFTCKTALKAESKYSLLVFGEIISASGEKLDKLPDYSFTTKK